MPTRIIELTLVVLIGLSLWLPTEVQAWGAKEHLHIGRVSYDYACAQIAQAKLTQAQRTRWRLACKKGMAQRYGQTTKLAGDWVSDPNLFSTKPSAVLRGVNSIPHGLFSALENDLHFLPNARIQYVDFHQKALDLALRANEETAPAAMERAFASVFYASAFADHFLQDSFAAGHAGFARGGSGASAARQYHNQFGNKGRTYANEHMEWEAFGDGNYDSQCAHTRHLIESTAAISVLAVLKAFVFGRTDPHFDRAVLDAIPNETAKIAFGFWGYRELRSRVSLALVPDEAYVFWSVWGRVHRERRFENKGFSLGANRAFVGYPRLFSILSLGGGHDDFGRYGELSLGLGHALVESDRIPIVVRPMAGVVLRDWSERKLGFQTRVGFEAGLDVSEAQILLYGSWDRGFGDVRRRVFTAGITLMRPFSAVGGGPR